MITVERLKILTARVEHRLADLLNGVGKLPPELRSNLLEVTTSASKLAIATQKLMESANRSWEFNLPDDLVNDGLINFKLADAQLVAEEGELLFTFITKELPALDYSPRDPSIIIGHDILMFKGRRIIYIKVNKHIYKAYQRLF